MDLNTATGAFEEFFRDVTDKVTEDGNKDHPVLWSGGVTKWDDISPALFSSEERAITAWSKYAVAALPKTKTSLTWLIKPELIQYQTTIADRKQRHRVVSDRFTVKSQFLVNGLPVNG